eukprot:Blabericola_migrator_1__12402@NODE_77_length_15155_cov_63_173383_g69_i0_p5_GENE_NODE_77_length_15155_cov_63_173383_g69_i0NODE_77_length_15155_cov_63_173383_g69_i0_p5_ORF_typecomplete_len291_score37_66_NODE_77_length_15155_cov_63_173383_g69_i01166212534
MKLPLLVCFTISLAARTFESSSRVLINFDERCLNQLASASRNETVAQPRSMRSTHLSEALNSASLPVHTVLSVLDNMTIQAAMTIANNRSDLAMTLLAAPDRNTLVTHLTHPRVLRSQSRLKKSLAFPQALSSDPASLLNFVYYPKMDVLVVENPYLSSDEIMRLAMSLPCIRMGPVFERHRLISRRALGIPQLWLEGMGGVRGAVSKSVSYKVGKEVSDFISLFEEVMFGAGSNTSTDFQFTLPFDPLLPKQWYIFGPSQEVAFGTNCIDGWATIALLRRIYERRSLSK